MSLLRERHMRVKVNINSQILGTVVTQPCSCSFCKPLEYHAPGSCGFVVPLSKAPNSWWTFYLVTRRANRFLRVTLPFLKRPTQAARPPEEPVP